MGFLSSIASTVTSAVKEGARNGLINGFLSATGQKNLTGNLGYSEYEYDANGHIKGVNKQFVENLGQIYGTGVNDERTDEYFGLRVSPLNGQTKPRPKNGSESMQDIRELKQKYKDSSKITRREKEIDKGNQQNFIKNILSIKADDKSDMFRYKSPSWGYDDFINERSLWQKHIGNIFDEPAWFYFKVFFDFDTNHGLFGGLLNTLFATQSTNSAAKYLNYLSQDYEQEKPIDRINALYKFASILSYINTNAPWYFKSIKGLDQLSNPILEDFSKERTISLEVSHDAIDMRLTTLMSLYKFACYDDYTHKEIIPENLRKFNMSIILFQSPLRYLHTSFMTNEKKEFLGISSGKKGNKVNYKTINPSQNYKDLMSFKIYSLYNCEFDISSFAKVIPGSISNDTPFQLGGNEINIKYDFCVEHQSNEFYEMMFGTNGFYFNQYANFQLSKDPDKYLKQYKEAHEAQLERYQALYDIFGNTLQGGTILGLLDSPRSYKKAVDATEAIMNGMFTENNNLLGNLGTNFLLGLLGSSKSVYAPQGNIYGDYGIDSAYYKEKLKQLKQGTNINTKRSYTYDAKNAVAYEKSKINNYSALEWEKTKNTVSNFDVKNWLTTGSKSLGSSLNNKLKIF